MTARNTSQRMTIRARHLTCKLYIHNSIKTITSHHSHDTITGTITSHYSSNIPPPPTHPQTSHTPNKLIWQNISKQIITLLHHCCWQDPLLLARPTATGPGPAPAHYTCDHAAMTNHSLGQENLINGQRQPNDPFGTRKCSLPLFLHPHPA